MEFPFDDGQTLSQTPLLHEAIGLFLQSKERSGFQKRYVVTLRQLLRRFERESSARTVKDAAHHFEKWMYRQRWQNTSLASNLGRMSSFFRFAMNRRWLDRNPCEFFEKPRIRRKTPLILTPEQARAALFWTAAHRPQWLGYLVLAMFAGVRPEELEKIGWGAVEIAALRVLVPIEASKVSRRRMTPIAPNAGRWLELAADVGAYLPVSQSSRKRFVRELRVALGFKCWPQDILRHTAASYMLARLNDPGQISLWIGNSPKILMLHYIDLVDKSASEQFWNIAPSA